MHAARDPSGTLGAFHDLPGTLGAFQDGFARALATDPGSPSTLASLPPPIARLAAQPGFAVYRNTVMKGCIDALQANYPAVARLVGADWFRAAAAIYVRNHPPRQPSLLAYGHDFANFLGAFGPAAELAYLPAVARLDRFWTEAHGAADATLLAPSAIAGMTPASLATTVLQPHPAARWAWFAEHPIVTIWSRNWMTGEPAPESAGDAPEIEWRAEGVLLTRPRGDVQWTMLARSGCAFLDTCAHGGTLADAAGAALELEPGADLAAFIAHTLEAGAFAHTVRHPHNLEEVNR